MSCNKRYSCLITTMDLPMHSIPYAWSYALIAAAVTCTSCTTDPMPREIGPMAETSECRTYLSMRTAPMAPAAVQRLQEACEASRKPKKDAGSEP